MSVPGGQRSPELLVNVDEEHSLVAVKALKGGVRFIVAPDRMQADVQVCFVFCVYWWVCFMCVCVCFMCVYVYVCVCVDRCGLSADLL